MQGTVQAPMSLSYTDVFDVFAQKHGADATERGTLFACTFCVYMGTARTRNVAKAVARHITLKHAEIYNDKVILRYYYSNHASLLASLQNFTRQFIRSVRCMP